MKIRKAVIPAAGLGTRFLPVTKVLPKELLPIGNKPAIQYVIEEAIAAGVEEIILVSHRSKKQILDYFRPDPKLRNHLSRKGKKGLARELKRIESLAKIRMVYQDQPLGLGHAILCAAKAVGKEPFLVMLPDVLTIGKPSGTAQLLTTCSKEKKEISCGLLLEKVPKNCVSAYGIVKTCSGKCGPNRQKGLLWIKGAVEKPKREEAPSNLSILGRYLLPPEIFSLIRKSKPGALGEIQLTDAINTLVQKLPGRGVIYQGKICDVGTPQGMLAAWNHFL